MSFTSLSSSLLILSIRFISNTSIDISGLTSSGLMDIRLVSCSEDSMALSPPRGMALYSDYHDFRLVEDIRKEVLGLLHKQKIAWKPGPQSGGYSLCIRRDGLPVLYWRGSAERELWL